MLQLVAAASANQETFQEIVSQADKSFNSMLGLLAMPEYSANIDTALVLTGPFLKIFSILMGVLSVIAIGLFVGTIFRDILAILLQNLGYDASNNAWLHVREDSDGNAVTSIGEYFKVFLGRILLSIIILGLFASNQLFPLVAKGMLVANSGLKTVYAFDTSMTESEARHMLMSGTQKDANGNWEIKSSTLNIVDWRYSAKNGNKTFEELRTEILAQRGNEVQDEDTNDEGNSSVSRDIANYRDDLAAIEEDIDNGGASSEVLDKLNTLERKVNNLGTNAEVSASQQETINNLKNSIDNYQRVLD